MAKSSAGVRAGPRAEPKAWPATPAGTPAGEQDARTTVNSVTYQTAESFDIWRNELNIIRPSIFQVMYIDKGPKQEWRWLNGRGQYAFYRKSKAAKFTPDYLPGLQRVFREYAKAYMPTLQELATEYVVEEHIWDGEYDKEAIPPIIRNMIDDYIHADRGDLTFARKTR